MPAHGPVDLSTPSKYVKQAQYETAKSEAQGAVTLGANRLDA